ncbi:MAG: MATE family efflux transporter [Oscillospiraceae bacterium]|nr:MATE family efflux transporter [Oscillospiraceae bacterium]
MEKTNEQTLNKLGVQPIKKLMLSLGIPMIISMILQAVYNIVDSAFVSNMAQDGESALNALTLAFPVQVLMVAVGIGTGVGVNALLSKSLGQGDKEKVGYTAGNAVILGIIIYVIFLIFGFVGVDAYISSQTSNELIFEMASSYLKICCIWSMGIVFFSIFEKLLQSTGLSFYSTAAQITGAVINIVLDPILIYGLLGLPEMGVKGAAYATIIGQIASFVMALFFHLKKNKDVPMGLKYFKLSGKIVKGIYAIGLPAIIAQALMSVMTYCLNVILVKTGESLVTAYGLYYKIQQFVLFAAFGLRDAITPIVSFNHGMKSRERVKQGEKYGILYTLIIMVIGLVLIEVLAVPFAKIFGLSGETQELCISAMRIISISFVFAGLNIALQGVFQALNSGLESLIISICRQFLFIVPTTWGISKLIGNSVDKAWVIWLAFPVAEALSAIIACIFMRRINKNKVNVLD